VANPRESAESPGPAPQHEAKPITPSLSAGEAPPAARRFEPIAFDKRELPPRQFRHRDRLQSLELDARELAEELKRNLRGEVRFDSSTRALYATDASNYRQVPIGVVFPRDLDEVRSTVAIARKFGAPVLGRGGGTSLAGQCCNVAVVIDTSKYFNRLVEVDPRRKLAMVEPGLILDDLRTAAERHKLTFGPDPATHNRCTLGGMIGNNSCGVHSIMSGRTSDNIEELEVLTYDGLRLRVGKTSDEDLRRIIAAGGRQGEIYARLDSLRHRYADLIRARYPDIPRRVSGYNLDELLPEKGFNVARALVGTECTCVLVLQATTRLIYSPPVRALLVIGFPDIFIAADCVPELLKFEPVALEGIDDRLLHDVKRKRLHPEGVAILPEGTGWLLMEFGGESRAEAQDKAKRTMEWVDRNVSGSSSRLLDDRRQEKAVWGVRESGLGATAYPPGQRLTWEGWEDSAVHPDKLGAYLRDLRKLFDRYGYNGDLYGHFGHGCVHTRNYFDLFTQEGIAKFRGFLDEAADLVLSYGGSLSGEHGDGQARADLLPKMFGPELIEAFREFKAIWDPDGKMNPGKVIDPYHIDENLRLGTGYNPWQPETHFQFPGDNGSFARAMLRCVGVGECRRLDHGTMCPSFMATREEEHSTRGRARLLGEMFRGEVIPSNWRNEAVKESLDLCLACKACKGECPVNVDMATYKAEFLSHYYAGRLRPRTAYAMGRIHTWARIGSQVPHLVNFLTQVPPFSSLARFFAGIAGAREIPRFANLTFRYRLARHRRDRTARGRVILWADTFNNYFRPDTAMAAFDVLEAAGYWVEVPRKPLCCGRPLYDFGFLDRAKAHLVEIMDRLSAELDEGIPIIVLEPSCASVFRDELLNFFPKDPRAQRLASSVMLLSEFVEKNPGRFPLGKLERSAVVQGHCHQQSLMRMTSEEALLRRLGLKFSLLDSGCCGMAGAFGFESEHMEISMRIGERVLFPAVRGVPRQTLIIANGFSCREQIRQATGREALHIAEVLAMAIES
jgi:FAD/FMN-containing dehydrogenase/Fe-S oxidoreductase